MIQFRCLSFVAALLLLTVPLLAGEGPSEALLQDAASYAEQRGVGIGEAVRRLQLQRAAGDLEAAVAEQEREAFAGLWIEHAPRYRVVARFTNRAAEARLKARVAGGPLEGLVETRSARWSLAQLEAQQAELKAALTAVGEDYNSQIDVADNEIELYTTDPLRTRRKLAAAGRALPAGVRAQKVERLSQRQTLVGGTPGYQCTFGFPVLGHTGELGITTAAHCPDNQYYLGATLWLRHARNYGDWDIQWNTTCDIVDVTNQIDSGIGLRRIYGTRSRSQQTVGTYLCKNGMGSGRTCGYLDSRSFDLGPNHNATFIRVEGGAIDQSKPGDSGAPWFVEDLAYGSHVAEAGADGFDAIYMAINYLSDIGATVLTYDPGPGCHIPPVARLTYTQSGVYYYFDASGSYDADGSIISYHWDFGDGTSETTTSPYITRILAGGTFVVTVTVTDNEYNTDSDSVTIVACGGPGEPDCPY